MEIISSYIKNFYKKNNDKEEYFKTIKENCLNYQITLSNITKAYKNLIEIIKNKTKNDILLQKIDKDNNIKMKEKKLILLMILIKIILVLLLMKLIQLQMIKK